MTVPNKLLSTGICQGLADWFIENKYFKNVLFPKEAAFRAIESYYRVDFRNGDLTSITIYPITSETETQPTKENGLIGIDVVFDLSAQRTNKGNYIYATMNMIRGNLLTNPTYVLKYVQNYVPGLMKLNTDSKIDYSGLKTQIKSKSTSYTVTMTLKYKIGLYLNQLAIMNPTGTGGDFYDPNGAIYTVREGIDLNTNTNLVSTTLESYTVSPTLGYKSTGTLITPKGWSGLAPLLTNGMGTYYDKFNNSYINKNNFITMYVPTQQPPLYPFSGVLILPDGAQNKSNAILLGDNGIVYDIIYNGYNFGGVKITARTVLKYSGYPADGTLVSIAAPQQGVGALLFGADNILYRTKVL